MKIKEYGYIKPKEIKCNHCGAILEYTNCDIKMKERYSNFFDGITYYGYIQCPVCGKYIYTNNDGSKIIKLY